MNINKLGCYFFKGTLKYFFIIILFSTRYSGVSFAGEEDREADLAFQVSDYFALPYLPRDINQKIILVELNQSKSLLERAYSSSNFGAGENDGQVGYFEPRSQYRYHSEYHYFEEDKRLKQGQDDAWDGKFLNWLLMRQTDMTRYLLLGSQKKNDSVSSGLNDLIILDSSKHKIILQDVKSQSYSPIPNSVPITIEGGQLKYQGKSLQLRFKSPHYQKGLLDLVPQNIDLYFYTQTKTRFIFGGANTLPSYLKNWSMGDLNDQPTHKEDSLVSLKRALEEIKMGSLKDTNSGHQSRMCQEYVYLSLSPIFDYSQLITRKNLSDDCQKAFNGKQALTYYRLMASDNERDKAQNSFTFHGADKLMASIFKVLFGDYTEGSYQISGADMAYFPDQTGVIYQSLYKYALTTTQQNLHWLGDLRATLIDDQGRLRSDNGDKKLGTLQEDPIVSSCFDEQDKLLRIRLLIKPSTKENCNALNYPYFESDIGNVWQASEFFNKVPQESIHRQRTPFQSNDTKRYIRTHIGQTEYDFIETDNINDTYPVKPEWMNVGTQQEANKLIAYIRGQEQEGIRRRYIEQQAYLLGDTANSSPVVVGNPSSNYHLLYNDQSYQQFSKQYQNRRSRIFLGANDGMLHSFNAGWFDSQAKQLKSAPDNASQWSLGQEIWAFVPFSALPYLREISDKYYGISPQHHLNISPQTPYIFDAQVFTENGLRGQENRRFIDQDGHQISHNTHPQGWGTLMVVGSGSGSSSYLVFDITDAEQAPKLMAELNMKNSGSAISFVTVMTQKNQQGSLEWSLVLGSGTDLDSDSISELSTKRSARLYLFNLKDIQSVRKQLSPRFIDLKEGMSYVSGISAADWNLDGITDALYVNTANVSNNTGNLYRVDTRHVPSGQSVLKTEKLLNVPAPIIGRPQLSMDSMNNRWIYISTAHNVTTKNRQSIFSDKGFSHKIIGLKEPRDSQGSFLIESSKRQSGQVSLSSLVDVSGVLVHQETGNLTGSWVIQPQLKEKTVNQLEKRLMQFSDSSSYVQGWLRSLDFNEVSTGPSSLFGGVLTQATYRIEYKNCLRLSDAYMHRLRFTTGTSWYAQGRLEDKAEKKIAELKSTKSNSLGSREVTSILLQGGSDHVHQVQSSTNGNTQTTSEESRKLIKSGEVSWREL